MHDAKFYVDCFHKRFPDQHVTSIYDYDRKFVLLVSSPGRSSRDFGAEFLVSKDGKQILNYNPFTDQNYVRVVNAGPIYKS